MEAFGPILFALLVLGSVGHALYKKYKDHRTSKRVAAYRPVFEGPPHRIEPRFREHDRWDPHAEITEALGP